ncbi:hypothetical protein ACT4RS_07450 [Ornithobacterium rhinotracheale]|uniref:hypothetical protein n=1 Tax=Ornithobacterium rhinotracheale TaxID=28251 RepID=UPI004036B6E4
MIKHWSYYLEDKGVEMEDLSERLSAAEYKRRNLEFEQRQVLDYIDTLEAELEFLMADHWSAEEINEAKRRSHRKQTPVRLGVSLSERMSNAITEYLRQLPVENNTVEFPKWELYHYICHKTDRKFSVHKLRCYIKEYCRRNKYSFMPENTRIQRKHNGQYTDFYQIKFN